MPTPPPPVPGLQMCVTYQMTEADYLAVARASVVARYPRGGIYRRVMLPIMAVGDSVTLLYERNEAGVLRTMLLLLLIVTLLMMVGPLLGRHYRFRTMRWLREPITISLRDAGIILTTVTFESKIPWTEIAEVAEFQDAFVPLSRKRKRFIPIAKRTLSDAEVEMLRQRFKTMTRLKIRFEQTHLQPR